MTLCSVDEIYRKDREIVEYKRRHEKMRAALDGWVNQTQRMRTALVEVAGFVPPEKLQQMSNKTIFCLRESGVLTHEQVKDAYKFAADEQTTEPRS